MPKIIFITCIFISSLIFSQETSHSENHINIQSLSISVDSVNELDAINWDDAKETFYKTDPESEISLEIKLRNKGSTNKSITKFAFSFEVKGKAKEIDSLVFQIKNGFKLIRKIDENLKNKN
jgi:hypothetical protein